MDVLWAVQEGIRTAATPAALRVLYWPDDGDDNQSGV
jgi:hypothetical protein